MKKLEAFDGIRGCERSSFASLDSKSEWLPVVLKEMLSGKRRKFKKRRNSEWMTDFGRRMCSGGFFWISNYFDVNGESRYIHIYTYIYIYITLFILLLDSHRRTLLIRFCWSLVHCGCLTSSVICVVYNGWVSVIEQTQHVSSTSTKLSRLSADSRYFKRERTGVSLPEVLNESPHSPYYCWWTTSCTT